MQVNKAHLTNMGRLNEAFFLVPRALCNSLHEWDSNVEHLLSDIGETFRTDTVRKPSHFIGNIFVITSDSKFLLIDGKRRLVATILILCALRDLMSEQTMLPQHVFRLRAIESWIAAKDQATNAMRPRVELEDKQSNDLLLEIIQGKTGQVSAQASSSYLRKTYERIKEDLKMRLGDTAEALADFSNHVLTKTDLIVVELLHEPVQDHQLFKTLNQTGNKLSRELLAK